MGRNTKDGQSGLKTGEFLNLATLRTHTGHALTPQQYKFIINYVECANMTKAAKDAGYAPKSACQQARNLLQLDYIREEVEYRLCRFEDEKIASAEEIMKYFTSVMRGEVKDQFGLDAALSERTRAGIELAKRRIDMANKNVSENETSVKLVIERRKDTDTESQEE
jgi:phage terminase small subunit